MARSKGSANLAASLEVLAGAPLDARLVVGLKTDLTNSETYDYVYVGMVVFCKEDNKLYALTNADFTTLSNWKEIGSDASGTNNVEEGYYNTTDGKFYEEDTYTTEIAGASEVLYVSLDTDKLYYYDGSNFVCLNEQHADALQPGGSFLFANLPSPGAGTLGFFYDIQDAFTTTSDFIEGAGHDYPAGTNVYVVNAGTVNLPVYKYDILAGSLEGFQKKFQYSVMPTASADLLGAIVQFVGATTVGGYTNGYFYECVSDGEDPATYSWLQKAVQAGGGAGSLEKAITAAIDVGGIDSGDSFAIGTSYDDLWDALLNPTLFPSFTNPSASLAGTGDKILEAGSSLVVTLTATFNRGTIDPAYGTSGYRAGAAVDYTLNSGVAQSENTWSETVTALNNSFQAAVSYAAGEQPKDSKGENYGSPLEAGSVNTNTVSYEFVDAIWANTAAIGTIAKLALVSKSTKQKDFSFPAQTVANPEVFDIPASWTVTAVQVKNDLSGQWENASSQFTVTDVQHDDAAGVSVNYKRYTFNLGYGTGARQVRVKWS